MTETEKKRWASVAKTLMDLDYRAIKPSTSEEWRPIEEVGSRYGTTDETQIQRPGANQEHARLFDEETGEELALARKQKAPAARENRSEEDSSESRSDPEAGQGSEESLSAEEEVLHDTSTFELERLTDYTERANTCIAAYLAGHVCKRKTGGGEAAVTEQYPSYDAKVTSANLAVLKACDVGVSLADLDKITFDVCSSENEREGKEGGGPVLKIIKGDSSVSVPVAGRPFNLREPWGGELDIIKVYELR